MVIEEDSLTVDDCDLVILLFFTSTFDPLLGKVVDCNLLLLLLFDPRTEDRTEDRSTPLRDKVAVEELVVELLEPPNKLNFRCKNGTVCFCCGTLFVFFVTSVTDRDLLSTARSPPILVVVHFEVAVVDLLIDDRGDFPFAVSAPGLLVFCGALSRAGDENKGACLAAIIVETVCVFSGNKTVSIGNKSTEQRRDNLCFCN